MQSLIPSYVSVFCTQCYWNTLFSGVAFFWSHIYWASVSADEGMSTYHTMPLDTREYRLN